MDSRKRPLSVTLIAAIYLVVGAAGFVGHFHASVASPRDGVWVELTELLAFLSGTFLLGGRNWARWLALGWIAFHVVLSAFETPARFAIHGVFLAVIAWILFRREVAPYFRGARPEQT
jgi:hypothetical protein